ncbi:membrane protein [Streptomyces phage LilMartin]|nr:membrane protein [Streptomyces phage LilMartin]UVK61142.1 membrane protein [Streptomyces phage Angela]
MTAKIWYKTDQVARGLRKPINTAAISIMGVYTFMWGLWLALPWPTFNTGPVYGLMASLAPEIVWGVTAMCIGTLIIWGVASQTYKALLRGALAGFYYWLVISVFYMLGSWSADGWINAFMVAVYCAFVAINLRVNRKTIDSSLHDNKEVNKIRP